MCLELFCGSFHVQLISEDLTCLVPSLLPTFPFNPTRVFLTFNPVKDLTYYILTTFSMVEEVVEEKETTVCIFLRDSVVCFIPEFVPFQLGMDLKLKDIILKLLACGAPVPPCLLGLMLYTFSCFSWAVTSIIPHLEDTLSFCFSPDLRVLLCHLQIFLSISMCHLKKVAS